jgi:hypothetical protein
LGCILLLRGRWPVVIKSMVSCHTSRAYPTAKHAPMREPIFKISPAVLTE